MNSKNNPFANAKSTWRKHVKNGDVPKWLIERWVSTGHEDPRKAYQTMTVFNVVSSVIVLFCFAIVLSVLNTAMSKFNTGIGDMIAPAVIVCFFIATGLGYLFMGKVLEKMVIEKVKRFEDMLDRLVFSPRPHLTPADLADDRSLRRAIESGMVDLAARKVVFSGHEKKGGGNLPSRSVVDMLTAAHIDLGKLLDVGKQIRILSEREDFTRFFAEASATRVSHIQREFDKMLAGLKPDEQPPLYW